MRWRSERYWWSASSWLECRIGKIDAGSRARRVWRRHGACCLRNTARAQHRRCRGDETRPDPRAFSMLLRMLVVSKPDRIMLAELRDDETNFYLRNVGSGHPGSITTIRANSAAAAVEQLILMVRQSSAGAGLTREDIRGLVSFLPVASWVYAELCDYKCMVVVWLSGRTDPSLAWAPTGQPVAGRTRGRGLGDRDSGVRRVCTVAAEAVAWLGALGAVCGDREGQALQGWRAFDPAGSAPRQAAGLQRRSASLPCRGHRYRPSSSTSAASASWYRTCCTNFGIRQGSAIVLDIKGRTTT